MYPTLLQIGPLALPSYGVLFAAGICLAVATMIVVARTDWPLARRPSMLRVAGLALSATILAPIVAIVGIVVWRLDRRNTVLGLTGFVAAAWTMSIVSSAVLGGGRGLSASWVTSLSWLLIALIAGVVAHFTRVVHGLRALDAGVAGACLGHALHKLGCFLAGCCPGTVGDAPWCLRFPRGSQVAWQQAALGLVEEGRASLPVHPHQLYSFVAFAVIGAAVFVMATRTKVPRGVSGGFGAFAAIATWSVLSIWRQAAM
jgi:phosphatidylglycerol:prolipoprotein diacylglycerol transferase